MANVTQLYDSLVTTVTHGVIHYLGGTVYFDTEVRHPSGIAVIKRDRNLPAAARVDSCPGLHEESRLG